LGQGYRDVDRLPFTGKTAPMRGYCDGAYACMAPSRVCSKRMLRHRNPRDLNRPFRALDTGVVVLERANGTEPEAA
jgi:hypothetical protein